MCCHEAYVVDMVYSLVTAGCYIIVDVADVAKTS